MNICSGFITNKNTIISFLFVFVTSCNSQKNRLMRVVSDENTTFPNALVLDYLKIYEYNN